jgi:2-polyprenyl-3-methyl-5-hydroxy-6-metoxy-1,4-benzoquinol methylase
VRRSFQQRTLWSAANRASRLGSRIGWDWLTYNPGVLLHFHWLALDDAPRVADALMAHLPPFKTIADVGCGSGAFTAEFRRRGFRIAACERSLWGRWLARRQGVAATDFDVASRSPGLKGAPFDLVMSLEVAEHIPPALADAFVQYLVVHAGRTIVLTAAHPGQGGQGHVNEQPKSYWIERLRARGWALDAECALRVAESLQRSNASPWLCQNVMIFRPA